MKQIAFRPEAEADLGAIWDYTAETWGRGQASTYVQQIRAVIEDVADGRKSGITADSLRAGYSKAIAVRHVVFYRDLDDAIEIVRVLHERMDIEGRV